MAATVGDYGDAGLVSAPDLWRNGSASFNATSGGLSPMVEQTLRAAMIVVLINTMVSLGCIMDFSKMKTHMMKPKGVAIALVSQYGVMPLTAFCLAKAFQLTGVAAVVILVCGCSPGGQFSNLMTLALQGDMNLSIVMTSCSLLLALGMMPLLLFLFSQGFLDLHKAVPYGQIILALFLMIMCSGIGMLIKHYRPRYAKTITKVGLSLSMLAYVGIFVLACVDIGLSLVAVVAPPLVASAALMPFIGYVFGYIFSSVCGLNQAERRTVAIETGCQQVQLCVAILKVLFPPAMMGPLFLFPVLLWVFQISEAVVIIVLFRAHRRFTPKRKGETNSSPGPLEETYMPALTEDHGPQTSADASPSNLNSC